MAFSTVEKRSVSTVTRLIWLMLVSVGVSGVVASLSFAEDRTADKRAIGELMAEVIQLLENEKYEAFVEKFMPPGMTHGPEWMHRKEERIQRLNEKAPTTIQIFKKASQQPPQFYANGRVAVYELKTPLNSLRRIAWVKHRGLWFLFDEVTAMEDISYLGSAE